MNFSKRSLVKTIAAACFVGTSSISCGLLPNNQTSQKVTKPTEEELAAQIIENNATLETSFENYVAGEVSTRLAKSGIAAIIFIESLKELGLYDEDLSARLDNLKEQFENGEAVGCTLSPKDRDTLIENIGGLNLQTSITLLRNTENSGTKSDLVIYSDDDITPIYATSLNDKNALESLGTSLSVQKSDYYAFYESVVNEQQDVLEIFERSGCTR